MPKTKHGHTYRDKETLRAVVSPTYKSWQAMRQRCANQKNTSYSRYGGRGITVCEEWESFDVFLKDMGERPEGTSIDRIDNSKGYYPENCRWATQSVQNSNLTRGKRPDMAARVGAAHHSSKAVKLEKGEQVLTFESGRLADGFLGVACGLCNRQARKNKTVKGWKLSFI